MSCVALSCDILCCLISKKQNMSVVKDNQDSFRFVDKTEPTLKVTQSGIWKAPLRPIK